MAINYNWDCKTLEIHLNHTDSNNIAKEDVVFKVLWTLTAIDENKVMQEITNSTFLPINDLSNFTEVKDLTNDIIKEWVFEIEDKEAYEEKAASLLLKKIEPTTKFIRIN